MIRQCIIYVHLYMAGLYPQLVRVGRYDIQTKQTAKKTKPFSKSRVRQTDDQTRPISVLQRTGDVVAVHPSSLLAGYVLIYRTHDNHHCSFRMCSWC